MRPGASGVVLDAQTRGPIAGAEVILAPVRGDDPVGRTTTTADGAFAIPPRRQWGVYLVPGDIFPFPFRLSVQRAGYHDEVIEFYHRAMGDGTTRNFREVRLESVTK